MLVLGFLSGVSMLLLAEDGGGLLSFLCSLYRDKGSKLIQNKIVECVHYVDSYLHFMVWLQVPLHFLNLREKVNGEGKEGRGGS